MITLATIGALFSVGCDNNEEDSDNSYAPGTYEGTAPGHSGEDLSATVTVNETEIESIELTHNDTPNIADEAADTLSESMIENNSTDVDVVSGATSHQMQ